MRHLTLVFEWGKSIGFVQPPKFISRILQKFQLNITRPTARFMTVPGYVDSEHLVWRRRWFDSTSPAARTFNVGQCVMVCDTSSRNRNYSLFSHASCPPAMKRAISNSRHTTPPPGALRWVGRILVDEAKRPKPESRDNPIYFVILTLFGS